MESENNFNEKLDLGEISQQKFSIEVVEDNNQRLFSIQPLGHNRYEILDDDGSIGTLQLDESDHAHCESQGCELDLPLLHAIRDQIQSHLSSRKLKS